jgi:hypothetical protein
MSLTPLQLNTAAGLLQNQGLASNVEFVSAVTTYNSTALINPFLDTIQTGSANILSNTVIATLETLAANTCASLSDSVPAGYATLTVDTDPAGFTGLLITTADTYLGNNDLSLFCQSLSIAQAYISQTNLFVNSAVNSQTYLSDTFTTMNSMISGGITNVNLATETFGTDLANLGQLIDLKNLNNFGSPLALVQQLYTVSGTIPIVSVAFIAAGVSQEVVLNLTNPTATVSDSTQRLMYQAMTQITGAELEQILTVLSVTTVGINTMADLLNPLKLFPNSFQSLTAPTAYGPRAIYVNQEGSVNPALVQELPPYVISSLV